MNEYTLRCRIRHFEREDAADVYAFASLPEVAHYANFLPHRSLAMTQENLRRWKAIGDIFAIELPEEKKVIGAISLRPDLESQFGWIKIGYTCNPLYQGAGYINEALRKVMDHSFYDQELPGIALHIFADNLPSIKVAQKAGFGEYDEANRKVRFDGIETTEFVYRMTNGKYKERFGGRWFGELRDTKNMEAEEMNIIHRAAVRAVIRKGDCFLMVQSQLGDVKFPGGGIETNELPIEALKREVAEETGYKLSPEILHLGYIEEFTDAFESEVQLFAQRSDYYEAEVEDSQVELKLDDYEAELGFHPVWITLDNAIKVNQHCVEPKRWTKRDLKILMMLKQREDKAYATNGKTT